MNTNSNHRPFWPKIIIIFMIVSLVLTALPIQTASAATEGFTAPDTFSNSALANPGNAFASDDLYVQSSLTNSNNNKKSAEYGKFGFDIPADAVINLVEVSIEGHGTKDWKVAVSTNNGLSYSAYATISNTVNDTVTVTSGPGTLWGLTGWSADSLTDANFKVLLASSGGNGADIAYLDQLMVRIVYTPVAAAPTTLVITASPVGIYGGTVNLTAELTASGVPLPDQPITFAINGFSRGTAMTNASGIATLSNVDLITGLASTFINVGNYGSGIRATFLGDDTYAYSTDTEALKVNRRPITITADSQTKVYGSDDPLLTYQLTSGSLVGVDTFSGTLTRAAGENVGIYSITQGTLELSSNYTITYQSNNLTITPLDLIVTADNKSIRLNDPDPTFTFATSRFVGSETFITNPTCSVPDPHTTAGTYAIICSGADAGSNYTISYVAGILTVSNKFILTVTANPQTKTYGASDPVFTFTYNGFVDGDTQSVIDTPPTCSVAVPHTNVGSYNAITCGGGADDKYDFSYVSGTLTINPRAITVKADPKTKTYGAIDPALTSQVISGSLAGSDTFSGALSRAAGENVGVYAITQGTLTLGANYLMTYVGDSLTINEASLIVTADNQTKGLGAADPVFTFEYAGFVNGETSSVINTQPTCGVSGPHTSLGTYPIVCSGGSDNNYSFSYVNGTLMVLPKISGNVGVSGATLSYMNNGLQTVTSDGSGNYSIFVPAGWSGTVRPFESGYNFIPSERSYSNVQSNQTGQNFTAQVCVSCADVNVVIGGTSMGQSTLPAQGSTRQSFIGFNAGPVQIESTNAFPLIGAERVIYKVNGVNTSFSEMMALPNGQLDDTYWLPWYNNVDLDTQLRFGNVSGASATVRVYIGGTEMTSGCTSNPSLAYPFVLANGASIRVSCTGINNGPVQIQSTGNIVAAERVIYKVNGLNTSFTEMMALPDGQLSTNYWLPWYNNVDLDTQLRFGNVSGSSATVRVYIGGTEMTSGCTSNPPLAYPFVLANGASIRVSCAGVNNGPVQIESTGHIVAAERVIYKVNGVNTSFSEMMALPNSQLNTTYWLPWYNNVDLDTQLRFGNVSGASATVRVYIGGVEMTSGCTSNPPLAYPYVLADGASIRVSCAGINNGPVKIESTGDIVAAERVIYKVNGLNTSFTEMMGLPNNLLDVTYWLPWYNNVDLDTQLRFGVP